MNISKCDCESEMFAFKSDCHYMMHNSIYRIILKRRRIILDIELDMMIRYNFNCST